MAVTPDVLTACDDSERAAVLEALIAGDPTLASRAQAIALAHLEAVALAATINRVSATLLDLDQDDLATRAGKTRYGYVEPTEAAWQLLEEALEPWLQDIRRRAQLGLNNPARRLGGAVIQALEQLAERTHDDWLLLGWAPDFADEAAASVATLLAHLDAAASPQPSL